MNILANAKGTINLIGGAISKNSPAILTGVTVAGAVATTLLTAKATIKAVKIVEEAKKTENKEHLTATEVVKLTWKEYVPVAAALTMTVGCAIGAHSVSTRRTAALAAGLASSNEALKALKSATNEAVGEETAKEIQEKANQAAAKTWAVPAKDALPILGSPDLICRDSMTGQFFRSNALDIQAAVNEFNADLNRCGILSANELLSYLGLEECEMGRYANFNIDDGVISYSLSTALGMNDTPILCIDWADVPRWKYI